MYNLLAINPPGSSGGVPLPVWIGAVVVIVVVGAIVAARRRR